MFVRTLLFLLISCIYYPALFAQNVTLSGYVKDRATGETLIGANVYLKTNPNKGTATNAYGFYSLTLPSVKGGVQTIVFSYVGYKEAEQTLTISRDATLDVELGEGVQMREVVVTAKPQDQNVQSTQMGTAELSITQIEKLPALMGEVDILKTLQLLPGVMSAGEGNSGFYVRGGGPDQNLILLDEATVYNTGHLLGFFSVFNADALKNTTLIKGTMPANYGGRLSSVVDVQMRDGNSKDYAVEGGIGLISSRLTVEGPLGRGKGEDHTDHDGSFLVAARRTYAFELAQPFLKNTSFNGTNYYFYDLNLKASYRLGTHDRIFLSGYFGRDVLNYVSAARGINFQVPYGNSTATLRWNHLFSSRLFSNTSVVYNDYNFLFSIKQQTFDIALYSGIRDWNVKNDWTFYPNPAHQLSFGVNYTYHTFTPNVLKVSTGGNDLPSNAITKYAHEAAVYVNDEWRATPALAITAGLRESVFTQVGPYTSSVSGRVYGNGEAVRTYAGLEPRLGFKYSLSKTSSLKGGVSVNRQYIHLVSSSSSTLPTDLWVPSTERVAPQEAVQYALGYFRNLHNNDYEASVELYYKDLFHQIEYDEYTAPDFVGDTENRFIYGAGRAYGAEFFFKKRTGKLNGWVGYTLSRAERRFDGINGGAWFPTKYDRTHDLSVVANYDLSARWSFGAVFVFGTGNAFTQVERFYQINGQFYTDYGARNAARVEDYHRLDLSATYKPDAGRNKHFESSWNFSVYNAYNHLNTFATYYDVVTDPKQGSTDIKYIKIALFPIIPSVTWNFKWKKVKASVPSSF